MIEGRVSVTQQRAAEPQRAQLALSTENGFQISRYRFVAYEFTG